MNKEEFIKYIEDLKEDWDYYDELNEVAIKYNRDDSIIILPNSFDISIKLLMYIMKDEDKIIEWWIYEKNFGQDNELNLYDKNNNIINVNTAEELYNYLTGK